MNNFTDEQLDAWERAANLISRGWSIVPIKRGTKRPPIKNWGMYANRHPEKSEIIGWIKNGWIDFGVMCGPISNLIVVDIDDISAREWAMSNGLSGGPVVATGKGYHHYFVGGNDAALTKCIGLGGYKLDIITKGGMVLAPGSMHPSGTIYEWIDEHAEMMPLPAWIREAMTVGKTDSRPTKELEAANRARAASTAGGAMIKHGSMSTVTEGSRNVLLHKIAASCRGKEGMDYGGIIERIRAENNRVCVPPLDDAELIAIAKSALRYEAGIKRYELTDEGNVNRLIDLMDGNLRFVRNGGYWITWNGKRWVQESDLMIENLARKANSRIGNELQNPNLSPDEKKALHKHYYKSMSYNRIVSVAKLCKSDDRIWIDSQNLDTDPMLFNCPNGTLNLITGKLQDHSREDFITRLGGVDYDPELTKRLADDLFDSSWYRFCRGMFLHADDETVAAGMIEYFQRLLGYWLTGSGREQKWFLWRGIGANGKSTTMKVLRQIFGDYAIYLDVKTFMRSGRNSEANMARSLGARLVMTSEPAPGSQLDETMMKTATGGGEVEARYLYGRPFSYVPTWKIVMEANSRPSISGGDEGNYRRIHEINFQGNFRQWPENENESYYRGYSKTIDADLAAEISLIFAWIVQGALKFRRDGLNAPATVSDAGLQYRSEMDPIKTFLEDVCNIERFEFASSREIHRAYSIWCDVNGESAPTMKWLSTRLTEKGFQRTKANGVRGYSGLSINKSNLENLIQLSLTRTS